MLAAALDGIDNKLKAPKPLTNINVYELSVDERKAKGIKELPGSLDEALEELDKDDVLRNALGNEIYSAFRRAKLEEWEKFRIQVTDWEVQNFLEAA
jgi:glutamine synthetase